MSTLLHITSPPIAPPHLYPTYSRPEIKAGHQQQQHQASGLPAHSTETTSRGTAPGPRRTPPGRLVRAPPRASRARGTASPGARAVFVVAVVVAMIMKIAAFVGGCRGGVGVGCAVQGKVNRHAGLEAQMRWTGPAASGPLSTASVGTRPRRSSWRCRSTVALGKRAAPES